MLKNSNEKIIMGVDPGTSILGYSIISSDKNTIKIITIGILHLKKITNHYDKLKFIYDNLNQLIFHYQPEVLAIEAPFFGKNIQSMLKLGRAQGAAIVAAAINNIEIIEYSPRKIKQSITGKGNASKEQVAKMLKSIFNIEILPAFYDETDALAAAVCHHNSSGVLSIKNNQFKNWNDYLKVNPQKLAK